MIQKQICAFCNLVDSIKPEDLTLNDIVAIVKHLRLDHAWISEREFEAKWI